MAQIMLQFRFELSSLCSQHLLELLLKYLKSFSLLWCEPVAFGMPTVDGREFGDIFSTFHNAAIKAETKSVIS